MSAAAPTAAGSPAGDRRPPLARAGADRILLGVCAGIARRLGRDPWLIRAAFLLGTAAGGVGIPAYGVAAVALENPASDDVPPSWQSRAGMIAATSLLAFSIVLGLALAGNLIDTGAVISVSLLLAGASLVWRRTGGIDFTGDLEGARVIRIVLGLGLVLGGIVLYGGTNTDLSSAGAAVIAAGIVAAGAGLIFAPRLAATREALDEARRERIRAEEQEAIAARLHDSVLQTLALIEREAEPGSRAAALARRQERELRGVLYGEAAARRGDLRRGAAGDRGPGRGATRDQGRARPDTRRAARRADRGAGGRRRRGAHNAAKHAGVDTVSAMVRVGDDRITVFVRDRGSGFDPEARTEGHGIEGSIEGRLARVGGGATIDSAPDRGTEIELWAPLAPTPENGDAA